MCGRVIEKDSIQCLLLSRETIVLICKRRTFLDYNRMLLRFLLN